MDENAILECGVCFFQGLAKEFPPTTASADFDAPECPRCNNNDANFFEVIKRAEEEQAA